MNAQLQSTNERMRPWLTPDDRRAVDKVLAEGNLMSGREVAAFEEELAAYFGKRHAVCVSSGTAALECAMRGSASGHTISPDNFIAAQSAQMAVHGKWAMSHEGFACDLLGREHSIYQWAHDCAHTFNHWSARAPVSCFSFNQNKFIACVGGAMVTDHDVIANFARRYRNHGREGATVYGDGRNLRMSEVSAALGRSQLKRIDEILARRKQVARWYDEISTQKLADTRGSWFLYPWPNQPDLAKKHRSLADFRLFDTATIEDRSTALLPIWPLMTREDCEAACTL